MYPVIQLLGFGPGRWASSRERRMKSRTNLHSTSRYIEFCAHTVRCPKMSLIYFVTQRSRS